MPASDFRPALQPALAVFSAASISLAALAPLAQAAELAAAEPSLPAAAAPSQLAQQRGSGQRSAGSSERRRPQSRPSGMGRPSGSSSARPPRGSGAGALTRPAPGFDRGNRRPSGGWIERVPAGSARPYPLPGRPRPGLDGSSDRPGSNRPGSNSPSGSRPEWNRPGWDRPGSSRPEWNRPSSRPDWNRPNWNQPSWNRPGWNRPNWVFSKPVQINTIVTRPSWWGPRWSSSRPWRYGWYGGSNRWSWWNGSSLIWGVTALAGAALIGAAINDAIQANQPTIAVQNSPYRLVYGSVQAVGSDEVIFNFLFGETSYEARGNCNQGSLNGRIPSNPEEAQLLNTACQVAFGSF